MSKAKKIVKRIAPIALPIAASVFAPGLGTALGAGLGLSGTAASVAGNAILGGAGGFLSGGDLKSTLTGAASGGLSSALSSGLSGAGSSLFGKAAGTSLDKVTGIAGLQGPTQGTGLAGALTRGLGGSGVGLAGGGASSLTGGSGLNLGNALKMGGSVLENLSTQKNNEEIERLMLEAQGRAQGQLSPFQESGVTANRQLSQSLSAGFNPGDLTQDPGYQFRKQQGEEALQRQLAAQGLSQSGAAIKAASEYNQGLADQTYNDAYSRWLAQNQQLAGLSGQGLGAAGTTADIIGDMGAIQGLRLGSDQESRNRMLSVLLSGGGAFA